MRERFELACSDDESLARLWRGDRSAAPGKDDSGSGFSWALAIRLKRHGGFSPTEFGQLLRVWDFSSEDKEKINYRYISRAWGNNDASSAEDEFDAVDVDAKPAFDLQWVHPFEATEIPKRRVVVDRIAARAYLSVLISPPGVGKTTFLLMLAVAVATGRSDILGFKVRDRTRVLLWNQEDELDELKRRLLAVMTAFDVKWSDLVIDDKPGIVLGSGVNKALLFAARAHDTLRQSKDAAEITTFIRDNAIGVAVFDPFVEMHPADENNNVEIAAVARMFRHVAVSCDCAVILAHHTRKPPAAAGGDLYAGNMDSGRGAGALNGVARMVATLYTIDAATAKRYGLNETDAKRYIRLDDAKSNLSLVSGDPMFFRREGVTIGGFGGEEVGVLRPAKLGRVKSATEALADENAAIRERTRDLLRKAPDGGSAVTLIADQLLEAGVIELQSQDTLVKRIKTVFAAEARYENGDTVKLIKNVKVKGQPGRKALLMANFAESSKPDSATSPPSPKYVE